LQYPFTGRNHTYPFEKVASSGHGITSDSLSDFSETIFPSGNRHTFPNGEGRETGIVSIRKRQDRIHHRARGNLAGINKVILYSVQNLI